MWVKTEVFFDIKVPVWIYSSETLDRIFLIKYSDVSDSLLIICDVWNIL